MACLCRLKSSSDLYVFLVDGALLNIFSKF